MKLSDRLERIAAKAAGVTEGYAADVGTDHGFVPIRLIESGKVKHVVAMDVRKGPLERACEHVEEYHMEDQIETRLSDGLKELKPGEADTVIIAGMGGELMLRILRDGAHVRNSVKHYILSPQSELSVFRHGLEELGFSIVEEEMLLDEGKYYVILHVSPGTMHYEHEYEYRILHVKLESRPISSVATELLTPDQLEMYQVYRTTLGNKPLIFGGGSPDTSKSEDLTGVVFVNGTRPGNQAVVDIAKSQVGNVGGQPYWSWYGFNSRVEWCACFVSWCYGQMGLSEPRFAACQSQGIPWFQSHGQWGARGYDNLAPGDAIFFDWDLDGSADHVGIVIGTDGSRVYTVEGNSGDACKIRSYDVNYECIKGYGLMNW